MQTTPRPFVILLEYFDGVELSHFYLGKNDEAKFGLDFAIVYTDNNRPNLPDDHGVYTYSKVYLDELVES